MNQPRPYAIGTPGKQWGARERADWLAAQTVKRSYRDEVLEKIDRLHERFAVDQYGELDYGGNSYPLYGLRTRDWDDNKPGILVTGGVHGYETSGVQGAIRLLETQAEALSAHCNVVVAPCISPWAYETINRWNPDAIDPNRSFYSDSPVQECALFMRYWSSLAVRVSAHIDLHETTDTDNSEFMPARAARDAAAAEIWDIPDGFYLVGDAQEPADGFQRAIIESVERVTHIAPPDADGKIIGMPLAQRGVINYEIRALGLCAGLTNAPYRTTTEVYPDSPKVDAENCILAQVAAVAGALAYIVKES